MTKPPVCNYEGSDYQAKFWERGGREYEDRSEAIALKRLLPKHGRLLLELGAGAGRNTLRYTGFDRIVLLDYSRTQLEQAQARLGDSANRQTGKPANEQDGKHIFVAADVYRLPFVDGLFDAATMIRTLHHMSDAPKALAQVRNVLGPGAVFILEFANKLNLKAIIRYALGRQVWNPFSLVPVEFTSLNFDFHPRAVRNWLGDLGFKIEKTLSVSYFRAAILKRLIPTRVLVFFDSILQWTGALFQLSPSVFMRLRQPGAPGSLPALDVVQYFKCPECMHSPLTPADGYLGCANCKSKWGFAGGIYDFREPRS